MTDRHAGGWRLLGATALAAAGLTGLAYAGWVATARRALFADIADAAVGDGAVSLQAARGSDALDAGWAGATTLLVVAALVLWCAARVLAGQRFGPVGFAGLSMVAVGGLVAAAGSVLASLVGGEPAQAGRAALGCSVIGVGVLFTSLGMFTGVVSLLRAERTTYLGYAAWNRG